MGRLGKCTEEPTLEMLIYGSPCDRTEQERPGFSKPVQLLVGRLSSEEYQRNSATRQPAPGSRAGSSPPPTLQHAGRRRTAVPTKRNSHDGKWEGDRAPPSDRTLRKEAARTRRTRRPQQPRKPSGSDKGPAPRVGERGEIGMAPRAGAHCHGPRLRLPGRLALLPPPPSAWTAAQTHRPEPCP